MAISLETSFEPSKPSLKHQSRHRVFAMPSGFSGCAWWRYRLPLAKLKKLGTPLDIEIANNADKHVSMEMIQRHLKNADLVSLQAPGHNDAHTLIRFYASEGKKVIVDYDDYSFDLDPGNPRYAELGVRECEKIGPDGKLIYRWRDKENGFDLASNIAKFEGFKACVKDANCITTTTDYLASKFRPINPNVRICPNSIDFDLWKPIQRPQRLANEIRIGWFGGDSHFVDLGLFKKLLPKLCGKYPRVKIVLQAPPVTEWQEFFKDIPAERLEWNSWADLRYYTLFLASRHWDIGLCPLGDTEFNRCKSSIKFFEFSALGAAVVAENMLPYRENITNGDTGFLASNEDEWFEAIAMLIEDAGLRHRMSSNAMDYVNENFNLDRNCRIWERAYLECLGIN